MKITMLGTGYVGLVSGTCFSEFGFNVCCVDKDNDKINKLKNNILPIYEPGLKNLVKKIDLRNALNPNNFYGSQFDLIQIDRSSLTSQ